MTAEEKTAARGRVATVVATAAVTVAVGVTAAALGGYLVPASDRNTTVARQAREQTTVIERPAVSQTSALNSSVVLVPVAPDGRSQAAPLPAPQEPELIFARYDTADEDHQRGRGHERHEQEDDDGDDD
jgi:hypothetical protein